MSDGRVIEIGLLQDFVIRPVPITFSVPWSQGEFNRSRNSVEYSLDKKTFIFLDSSFLAFWEDGSVKWSSHTLVGIKSKKIYIRKSKGDTASGIGGLNAIHSSNHLKISNNLGTTIIFNKSGSIFADFLSHGSTGSLLGSSSRVLKNDIYQFNTIINSAVIEKTTKERVVVLTTGALTSNINKGSSIDFKIRSYVYNDTDLTKYTVSVVYKLDSEEVLRSLGLEFTKSLSDSPLYDRHIKFTGSHGGILSESAQSVTGLWHAASSTVRSKQAKGEILPKIDDTEWSWDTKELKYVPSYDKYCLTQLSSHGFELYKRFRTGFTKLKVAGGSRNDGSVFIGSPQNGGLSVGIMNFWEKYPTELAVNDLTGSITRVQAWFYSPSAEPLEVSPYYDGLVASTHQKQLEALRVTYEDYEQGFGKAYGISRSFEVFVEHTRKEDQQRIISSGEFKEFSLLVRDPPVFIVDLNYMHKTEVFPFWSPNFKIATRIPGDTELRLEQNMKVLFEYYQNNVELNDWYGFWDYGDFMHTPDTYRHQWRYDVGGYAWDNSELSTDLWLWLYFLHTGELEAFRLAEAMTKHTSEVDIYHAGDYKGFGTRHGVQHWSDSSKQLRISNVLFRRFHYYLSGGDERIGELMVELEDSQQAMLVLDSHRKVQDRPLKLPNDFAMANIGLDWGSIISAWMTHWERRTVGWEEAKLKIFNSIRSLVELPHGFANNAVLMNVKTGVCKTVPPPTPEWAISHLSTVFGLNESITELIEIIRRTDGHLAEKLIKFWTDYAVSFNGPENVQLEKYGFRFPKANISLQQSHARCTGYVSWRFNDENLGKDAWRQFFHTDGYSNEETSWTFDKLESYDSVTGSERELSFITTNFTAQYVISAIYNLDKVGIYIEDY